MSCCLPHTLHSLCPCASPCRLVPLCHSPFTHSAPEQVAQLPLSVSDGRWHHICITWTTRDGFWEAYQDGERLGTGDNLAPWHPIKPGGVIILGQEQVRLIEKLRRCHVCACLFFHVLVRSLCVFSPKLKRQRHRAGGRREEADRLLLTLSHTITSSISF